MSDLPPFLTRLPNGMVWPFTAEAVWMLARALPSAQQMAFGEHAMTVLGYGEDYYTGWTMTPPAVAQALLSAHPFDLIRAYLLTINLTQLAEELLEVRDQYVSH